ncbi:hypothetical protein ACLESD_14330 [Pyxidicoccus sp. 3LFB2]
MCFLGGVAFYLVMGPADLERPVPARTPPPVARPVSQAAPVPAPRPPVQSPPTPPSVAPAHVHPPAVKKPAPRTPQTNEAWGTQRLTKQLKAYDFCGREAILRKQDIPRRYRLRAKFGPDGQGTDGQVEPAPVAMLNACIRNKTRYIFLGKPPEARDFEVELTLSFAHLRPTGKPETYDDQWNIDSRD